MTRFGGVVLVSLLALTVSGCGRDDGGFAEACRQADRLMAAGDRSGAESAYRRIVDQWPDCGPAYANLAFLRLEAGDEEGAVKYSQQALEVDPEMVAALTTLGTAYFKMGPAREDEAIATLDRAVKRAGATGGVEARATLAAIYYRRRKFDASIAHARSALAIDAGSGEAQYNLAVALEAQAEVKGSAGRPGDARGMRREAAALFRRFAEKAGGTDEAAEAERAADRLEGLVRGGGGR